MIVTEINIFDGFLIIWPACFVCQGESKGRDLMAVPREFPQICETDSSSHHNTTVFILMKKPLLWLEPNVSNTEHKTVYGEGPVWEHLQGIVFTNLWWNSSKDIKRLSKQRGVMNALAPAQNFGDSPNGDDSGRYSVEHRNSSSVLRYDFLCA